MEKWTIEKVDEEYNNGFYVIPEGDEKKGHRTVLAEIRTGEHKEQRARLMASAPELLEALQGMVSPKRTDCNDRKCGNCTWCKTLDLINKAKGGENV